MKRLLLLFFLCLLCFASFGQVKHRIDSIKNLIKVANPKQKAKHLVKISAIYSNSNLDSAIIYANKAIAIAAPLQFYEEWGDAHNFLGQCYYFKSNYSASIANFEKFRDIAIKQKDANRTAQALNNIANVLIDLGKTDEAIKKYEEVLAVSQKTKDPNGLSLAYGNLAFAYRYIGDNNKAIEYIFKQIKVDESVGHTSGLAHAYQQLGTLYLQNNDNINAKKYIDLSIEKFRAVADWRNLAVSYDLYASYYNGIKKRKKAIEQQQLALGMAEKYDDKRSLAIFASKLAQLYFEETDYELSANYSLLSIERHEQIKLQKTIVDSYVIYGRSLLRLNKTEQAKTNLDKGLAIALQQKSANGKKMAYEALTEYYIKVNQPDKALHFQSEFIGIKDSLLNENNNKQINELNTRYQTEKKQQQILLLNSENRVQGLELRRKKLELLAESLENDKNIFRIGTQELLLQKNKIQLAKKQVETKAKAQQIKLLASENEIQKLELLKRNIWLGVVIGVLLVMVLIGYLFYNRYKLKQEAKLNAEVLAQQDLATKAVLNAEENERERISGELHDGLGQMFSAVKMNLSAITQNLKFEDEHSREVFEKTINLVDESCKEVRVISHQMAPNVLLKSGLATAIRDFINKIDSRRLKINLETVGLQERLDQNVETVLYRIIQETVNNVIKHSGANTLDIQLNRDDEGINVMIEDNGKGFDASQIGKFEGIGLKNIRTRVTYLKGTVDFSSQPGEGALIAIFIPS